MGEAETEHGFTVHLRMATFADAPMLRHWDEQPHVMENSGDDDVFDWEAQLPRQVPWRELLIAEHNGRPIGFMQIIDAAEEETHYWGDCGPGLQAIDIWIGEADALNKGYGTQMMQLALARCFAKPDVEAVLIDPLASNTRAHRFYMRQGFLFFERRTFGDDDCFVYRLDRKRYETIRGELVRNMRGAESGYGVQVGDV